jgi:Domain of unknown function (DUF4232)
MVAPPKPPAHDNLEALIREARERQLRRRLVGAAAVAVAAALGLGIYALTTDGGRQSATASGPATGPAPLCRSAQLSGSAGFQGATQSMLGGITLQNTSAGTCSLPSARPLVSISWHGERLRTKEGANPNAPPWPRARVLAPGAKAGVYFQWWSCGGSGPKAAVRPTFTLRFGHGLLVTARSEDVTPAFCGGLGGQRLLGVSKTLVDR